MITFPISKNVLDDINVRIAEYDAGQYNYRSSRYAPEPQESLVIIPAGTHFCHGVWISAKNESVQFPEKNGNWIHLGLYPVISAFILLETLKNHDWNYSGYIPVVFQLENTEDILALYDTG